MTKEIFLKHWDRSKNVSAKWDELELKFGDKDAQALWIADMDFPAPTPVVEALIEKAKQGIYGYTSRPASYYESICEWTEKRFQYTLHPEYLVHTPGGVASFTLALEMLTEKGEAVLLTPPAYPGFFRSVNGTGRKCVTSPMREISLGKFEIDWVDFEEKIKIEKVKVFIFCNPHNPIGKVYTKEELEKILTICKKYQVRIIEDGMWRDLTFAPAKTTSLLELGNDAEEIVITCLSATKTFNMAGLHASFLYLPIEKERVKIVDRLEILDIHRNNAFSIIAMEKAFRKGEEWLIEALAFFKENMEIAVDFMQKKLPKLKTYIPESTYTLWVDFSAYPLRGEELTKHLTKYGKIATGNGVPYGEGGEACQRINLACSREVLLKSLAGLETAMKILGE